MLTAHRLALPAGTTWRLPPLCFQFPSSLLTEANAVEVISSPSSGYYLDAFDLSYPRHTTARNDSLLFTSGMERVITVDGFSGDRINAFDVTNPTAPTLIQSVQIEPFGGGYRISFLPTTQAGKYLVLNTGTAEGPSGLLRMRPPASAVSKMRRIT